ncbi:MAG: DUF3784 domain-containing protein [Alistipes sp.]|nr:DUF3784 domain-containing protein [Alistipes sp.]
MDTNLLIVVVAAAVLSLCSLLVLTGRCDWLIGGYKKASEEERAKFNLPRLRLLSSAAFLLCAIVPVLTFYTGSGFIIAYTILQLCIAVIILSKTWAKQK